MLVTVSIFASHYTKISIPAQWNGYEFVKMSAELSTAFALFILAMLLVCVATVFSIRHAKNAKASRVASETSAPAAGSNTEIAESKSENAPPTQSEHTE